MLIEHHGQCAGGLIGYAIPDAPDPISRVSGGIHSSS
jgi:hypothetical protein